MDINGYNIMQIAVAIFCGQLLWATFLWGVGEYRKSDETGEEIEGYRPHLAILAPFLFGFLVLWASGPA